mgnify:CR=1 FL=1
MIVALPEGVSSRKYNDDPINSVTNPNTIILNGRVIISPAQDIAPNAGKSMPNGGLKYFLLSVRLFPFQISINALKLTSSMVTKITILAIFTIKSKLPMMMNNAVMATPRMMELIGWPFLSFA